LHGSNEKIHDGMTGVRGSYDNVMMAINHANHFAIKRRINVVVTKDNYQDLPNIAKMMMIMVRPITFNFLPFRIENTADKNNAVKYSDIAPYIMEAIDILEKENENIKISIRYAPFCLFKNYEKYVAGYLQRVFDEYEWDEYTIRKFEAARFDRNIPELDNTTDKWELQIDALHKSIKHVANHSRNCLKCKYLHICDGIWKSYAKVWGTDEFKPVDEIKTYSIIQGD
jgi:radical SAM protein with 4Fe4S-binding SPASM domain